MKNVIRYKANGKIQKKPYVLITIYFIIGVAAFIFICDKWLLPWTIHSGDSVKVPYLVGKILTMPQKC